jgi:hypothetical protein
VSALGQAGHGLIQLFKSPQQFFTEYREKKFTSKAILALIIGSIVLDKFLFFISNVTSTLIVHRSHVTLTSVIAKHIHLLQFAFVMKTVSFVIISFINAFILLGLAKWLKIKVQSKDFLTIVFVHYIPAAITLSILIPFISLIPDHSSSLNIYASFLQILGYIWGLWILILGIQTICSIPTKQSLKIASPIITFTIFTILTIIRHFIISPQA